MSVFQQERPEPRQHCVTLRVGTKQNEVLTALAESLGKSKGEVVRVALDYWLQHSPEGKKAMKGAK
jgi:Ribbon-helix-helix protein, copG family